MTQEILGKFLSKLGLSNTNTAVILPAVILIFLILVIILLIQVSAQKRRLRDLTGEYEIFMRGKNGESLEEWLVDLAKNMNTLSRKCKNLTEQIDETNLKQDKEIEEIYRELQARLDDTNKKLKLCFCKLAIVKYNSAADLGGITSFVLVMLDQSNDGFIMNVIHAKEGSYPYIKRVMGGSPEMDLSREETRALETAMLQS